LKIFFDIDGTVLEQSIGLLRVIDCAKPEKQDELLQYYISGLRMQINPLDFISEGDELGFITGRSKCLTKYTKLWVKKYFPKAKLFITNVKIGEDNSEFTIQQIKTKSEVIKREKVDVYFEDNPKVVKGLRLVCPKVRIIQYGARF